MDPETDPQWLCVFCCRDFMLSYLQFYKTFSFTNRFLCSMASDKSTLSSPTSHQSPQITRSTGFANKPPDKLQNILQTSGLHYSKSNPQLYKCSKEFIIAINQDNSSAVCGLFFKTDNNHILVHSVTTMASYLEADQADTTCILCYRCTDLQVVTRN